MSTVVISTKVAFIYGGDLPDFANDLFARFNDQKFNRIFLMGVATQVIPPYTPINEGRGHK